MTGKRRVGTERSATRATILDATQSLMVEEGYASATARRVATYAGVKPALIQYYFPTMDDLLLAVYRRAADRSIERQVAALASPRPLHALWALNSDTDHAALAIEFMALANHRKSIRAEIAAYSERARQLQADALRMVLSNTRFASDEFASAGVSLLLAGAARALVMEQGLGISGGHDEARLIVERWLGEVEPPSAD
jgi:AcrR family transcriptional regulator